MDIEEAASSGRVRTVINEHPALAISITFSLLMVLRIVRVAQFDTSTAAAIATTADAVSVVLGTLMFVLPLFFGFLFVHLSLADRPWWPIPKVGEGWYRIGRLTPLGLYLLFVGMYQVPRSMVFVSAGLLMAFLLVGEWLYQRAQKRGKSFKIPLEYILTPLLAPVLLAPNVWLPSEVLYMTGTRAPEVGYVLDDAGGYLTVLREEGRNVVRLRSSDVTRRQICDVDPLGGKPLFSLANESRHKAYGSCPNP